VSIEKIVAILLEFTIEESKRIIMKVVRKSSLKYNEAKVVVINNMNL